MMKVPDLKLAAKVRELAIEDLEKEAQAISEHLMKLRFQQAAGQVENPAILRDYRRGLARVQTVLAEKRRAAKP